MTASIWPHWVAVVSLAADLASGVTLEHGLRTCLLATRLAERAGLDAAAGATSTTPRCSARSALEFRRPQSLCAGKHARSSRRRATEG